MVKLYVGSNFGNNKFGICGGASCDHAGNDAAAADDDDVAVAVAADDDGGGKLLHAVLVTISLPSQYFFSAGPHHGSWPNSVSVQNAIDLQPTLTPDSKHCSQASLVAAAALPSGHGSPPHAVDSFPSTYF